MDEIIEEIKYEENEKNDIKSEDIVIRKSRNNGTPIHDTLYKNITISLKSMDTFICIIVVALVITFILALR